jgi:hypothetical protein
MSIHDLAEPEGVLMARAKKIVKQADRFPPNSFTILDTDGKLNEYAAAEQVTGIHADAEIVQDGKVVSLVYGGDGKPRFGQDGPGLPDSIIVKVVPMGVGPGLRILANWAPGVSPYWIRYEKKQAAEGQ